MVPETRVFQADDGKDFVILSLAPFLTDPPVGQMDGQTELRWLRHATAVSAVACKNYDYLSSLTQL